MPGGSLKSVSHWEISEGTQASLPTCLMSTRDNAGTWLVSYPSRWCAGTHCIWLCFGSVWGPPFVWGLLDVSTSGCRLGHIIPLEKIPTGVSSFHSQASVPVSRPWLLFWLH